jgi:hypothetical protein
LIPVGFDRKKTKNAMLPESAPPAAVQRTSSSSQISNLLDGVTNSIGSGILQGGVPSAPRISGLTRWWPGVGGIAKAISSTLDLEEYEYLDVWGHRRQSAELSKEVRKQLATPSNSKQSGGNDAEMRELALSAGGDDQGAGAQRDEPAQKPDFLFEPVGFAAFGPLQFTKRFAGGVRADIVRYLPYSGGTWSEFFEKHNRGPSIASVVYLFCAYAQKPQSPLHPG